MRRPTVVSQHELAEAMPSDATILSMWAHPDDEAFVAAGALADAAGRGCRVVCVHATRGEQGWQGAPEAKPRDLGDVRTSELGDALAALGVDERRCLDYPDGGLAAIPCTDAVARLLTILEEFEPAMVVTFGPDGFTGHPDHKAISAWVTAAVRCWDPGGTTVRHTAVTEEWVRRFAPPLNEFNAFRPGYPVVTPAADLVSTRPLDEGLLDRKIIALRAHRSQTAHLFAAFGEPFMRAMAATEWFRAPDDSQALSWGDELAMHLGPWSWPAPPSPRDCSAGPGDHVSSTRWARARAGATPITGGCSCRMRCSS